MVLQEIRTKGIDAFPDKKVAKKKKSEDGDEHQEGGAVNITAADLAALDFHEDEQGADEGSELSGYKINSLTDNHKDNDRNFICRTGSTSSST